MNEKLKDIYFTAQSMEFLANTVRLVYPDFNRDAFLVKAFDKQWPDLALKEKMRRTAVCLHEFLPESYTASIEILKQAAPEISGFEALVFPEFVSCFGLHNWGVSLPALGYFTKYGSAEFAIRYFLAEDQGTAMDFMYKWSHDEHEQVRRLSSEGCRPRLPWGIALSSLRKNPQPILPILETLNSDPSETVRRSVANNLNDISKDHPDLILDLCDRWIGNSKNTDWIVKHACRTMLKAGNVRALHLFGFGAPDEINIANLVLDREQIGMGDSVLISFDLIVNTEIESKVRLEYAIDFVKFSGNTSRKVFYIKENSYIPGSYQIQRKHSFQQRTTRKHYPGEHKITILVNGVAKGSIRLFLSQ